MSYAENTKVPVSRSQEEIKKTLSKYGASSFAFAESKELAMIQFDLKGKRIKFYMHLPIYGKEKVLSRGISCLAGQVKIDQMVRSKWRSLALGIKAKLECVDAGITTLEKEFLAHIVLPNGSTVGDIALPQIENSYSSGKMPNLLDYRGER